MPGITLYSHRDLETALRSFNRAYNGLRQRVLDGLSPEMVPRQRLEGDPASINLSYRLSTPSPVKLIVGVVGDAEYLSQPDT